MQLLQHEGSYWTATWTIVSMEEVHDIILDDIKGMFRVKWTKHLEMESTILIELPGISKPISMISPKRLNALFTSRLQMQHHPSWLELRNSLYDRNKTDYTNRELFQISQYDSLIWKATGVRLGMPNGSEEDIMWEGDYADLEGVSEHEDFWDEDGRRYDRWANWGNFFRDLLSGEVRDLVNTEMFLMSYDGNPPDIKASMKLLGERVDNKMAQLEEWTED